MLGAAMALGSASAMSPEAEAQQPPHSYEETVENKQEVIEQSRSQAITDLKDIAMSTAWRTEDGEDKNQIAAAAEHDVKYILKAYVATFDTERPQTYDEGRLDRTIPSQAAHEAALIEFSNLFEADPDLQNSPHALLFKTMLENVVAHGINPSNQKLESKWQRRDRIIGEAIEEADKLLEESDKSIVKIQEKREELDKEYEELQAKFEDLRRRGILKNPEDRVSPEEARDERIQFLKDKRDKADGGGGDLSKQEYRELNRLMEERRNERKGIK